VRLRSLGGAYLHRLALLGVAEGDDDQTRAQKATLTLAAGSIIALAVIRVLTYWAFGLYQGAAIPFAYQVASLVSLVVFARRATGSSASARRR
jgi:hypothetical protein